MGAQCVVCHELGGHLPGQFGVQPAPGVDGAEFTVFGGRVGIELGLLAGQVGPLGVGLRMHRHILARGHRHGARDQPGDPGQQDAAVVGASRRHTQHQAGGGDDAVVGAEHGGAKPADAVGSVAFGVSPAGGHGQSFAVLCRAPV